MRILMIEDETAIAEAVAEVLRKHRYAVDLAHDGEYGLDCALSDIYDVVILDIMLPRMDGLQVLQEMRRNGIYVPVILLTARGELEDKIKGLDGGADDYMTKPFHTEELLARIRALERRPKGLHEQGLLGFGDLTLNPHTLTLSCQDREITLSPKEAQILEILINRKKTVSSKDLLIEKVWGYDSDAEDSHVETHISLLRKKMTSVQTEVSLRTIRGSGYILDEGRKERKC